MNTEVAETYLDAGINAHRVNKSILKILKALEGRYELNKIFQTTVESVKEISNASACSIFLKDKAERYLKMEAEIGYKEDLRKTASYDLDSVDPNGEKIGLTAWIALNERKFSAKERKEITNHRAWRGKYEDEQYSGNVCNTLVGVPLITNGKVIGVMKIENKQSDSNHPEPYFTQEEEYILDILSTIVATIVRNKQLTDEQDEQHKCRVELYKLGAKLQELNDIGHIISHFLRGLTDGTMIALNRAIYFEYQSITKRLLGRMAVGPLNKDNGRIMRDEMEKKGPFGGSSIPNHTKDEDFDLSIPLNKKISNSVINLEKYNLCSELAKELEKKGEKNIFQICKLSDDPEEKLITGRLHDFLKNLDFEDFIIIGIRILDEIYHFIFCDNIYSHREFDNNTKNLLVVLLGQMSKAMERIYSINQADAKKEEASVEAMAMLAHKIKNNLFPVPNRLSQALGLSEGNHELQKLLESCNKSVDDVYKTVEDLIEFRKNPPKINIGEPDSIKSIIENIIRELKSFSDINPKLYCHFEENNNPYVKVDFNAIMEVFKNLLSNTTQIVKSGKPEVKISIIMLPQKSELSGLIDKGNFIEITYEDNGPGVAVEDKDKIFESFFSRTGSNGLGLAYARKVIDQHGGKIYENGDQGQGARFKILLPVSSQERGL